MKLLILTFYYRPDLSAGSFRATALVAALRERLPSGATIDVITAQPNRYQSFSQRCEEVEIDGAVTIRRIDVPAHQSGLVDQARTFIHFARSVLKYTSTRKYDLVFATSSRLMTAALGALISRRHKSPLYLDMRDIFADTIKDVLPPLLGWPSKMIFSAIEYWTLRQADRINLVSRGFEGYFRERYGNRSFSWFTNGIDDEFLAVPLQPRANGRQPLTILYAGNIGEGQGLHTIVPILANALGDRAKFIVIGDGGKRVVLDAALRSAQVRNVELRPPMSREALIEAYTNADVLFLHLGAYEAFEKVLPSKLFEYAAMGKPLLAGVSGYAAKFITDEISNAAVFAPRDVDAALRAFNSLEIKTETRTEFIEKFARANIVRAMADDILACKKEAAQGAL